MFPILKLTQNCFPAANSKHEFPHILLVRLQSILDKKETALYPYPSNGEGGEMTHQ